MATAGPPVLPAGNAPVNPAAKSAHKGPPGVPLSAGNAASRDRATPTEPLLTALLPEGAGQDAQQDGQEPQRHHAEGFFNQPWVQNVLPLATSLAIHIGLITLGILLYMGGKKIIVELNKDQVIIPESKSIEKNAIPGGIPHPGLNNDASRDAAQDAIKDSANNGFSASVNNNIAASLGGQNDSRFSPFAGPSSSNGSGNSAFSGQGGGGTAPWGVPGGGGGLLPKSNFFGTSGNADKIIYLCDKSGSMLSVFGALKQQLKESINALDLNSGQQFNVVFFSDEGADALFKDGMRIATADNKKAAMDFVDNEVASGGTLPLPAIQFSMKEKPELLYVLTDGFDQIASFDDVINAFKEGDADGKMHINCIFLQSDEDPKLEQVLKQIADQGHGTFKKILKSDM